MLDEIDSMSFKECDGAMVEWLKGMPCYKFQGEMIKNESYVVHAD